MPGSEDTARRSCGGGCLVSVSPRAPVSPRRPDAGALPGGSAPDRTPRDPTPDGGDGVLHNLSGARPQWLAACEDHIRSAGGPTPPGFEASESGDYIQLRRDRTGFGRTSFFVRSFPGIRDRRSRIGSRVVVPSCLGRDAGRSSEAGRSARQVKCCPSGVRTGPEDVSGTISLACVVPLPTRAGKCFSML
jgi:hypothetical protein